MPLAPTHSMLERARAALPELPAARAERFERELSLAPATARLLAFRGELGDYYERALAADSPDPRELASWVTTELVPHLGDEDPEASKVAPDALARLVAMVTGKSISRSAAKEILGVMAAEGGHPEAIVGERGLALAGEGELGEVVERAIAANQSAVEQVRAGKQQAIGAIVGAVMRETKGRADGGAVQRMIRTRLGL